MSEPIDPIRWGILGTGNIAHSFAKGLAALPDAQLQAVGSRQQVTADAFGAEFSVPNCHSSYEALADDGDVDVIYVATPHTSHSENTIRCLEAGKPVLCEKPFALNAGQAERMIGAASSRGLFLMEAMWTRFVPAVAKTREWIASGAIGPVKAVLADMGFRARFDPASRLFNPDLGGGALLDLGVYPVSFASMILGAHPVEVSALAQFGNTGVDEDCAVMLKYESGALATAHCTVGARTPTEARIIGEEGWIEVHPPFYAATTATLHRSGGDVEEAPLPLTGNGYNYQAAAVMECLRAGELQSSIMPLDESLAIMQLLDRIRADIGLVYPGE
jgi:predicted dehydrogenase